MGADYLMVVSVQEGRYFPLRQKMLMVEARFDKIVMSTDPVPHVQSPNFNTELAWLIDRKTLQLHRLQRTPIKLQWYAIDLDSTSKEAIGYMILDIRLVQEKVQLPKWTQLLNSKYQKHKPEILIAVYLEKNTFKNKESTHHGQPVQRKCSGEICNVGEVHPQLNSKRTFYQIGPPDKCTDFFIFTIKLVSAANLNQVVMSQSRLLTPPQEGFYFCYSVFGNTITTNCFQDLVEPDLKNEEVSFKLRSSIEVLQTFFMQQHILQVLFCSDNTTLGYTEVALFYHLATELENFSEKPVCVEGLFKITPTHMMSCHPRNKELEAVVAVSMIFSTENMNGYAEAPHEERGYIPQQVFELPEKEIQSKPSEALRQGAPKEPLSTIVPDSIATQAINDHASRKHSDELASGTSSNLVGNSSSVETSSSSEQSPHHFCFTLDLRSIKTNHHLPYINCFLRYCYSFFGSTAPILTHPCVEVHPGTDVVIPHGYCAFNFATIPRLLSNTFERIPLFVQVFHKDKQGLQKDQLIGTAEIYLHHVMKATPSTFVIENKNSRGLRRIASCKIPVITSDKNNVGELHVIMTLDNLGSTSIVTAPSSEKNVQNSVDGESQKQQSLLEKPDAVHKSPASTTASPLSVKKSVKITEEEMIQAAEELQLWQEQQKMLFRHELREKESRHLQALTSEWKRRDTERELFVQRMMQECHQMQEELDRALADTETREHQLEKQKVELTHLSSDMHRQQERIHQDAKDKVQHIKDECGIMLEIERRKLEESQQENKLLQKKVLELEKKLKEKDSIIESLQEGQNRLSKVELQAEINSLKREKEELQRNLEATKASKCQYKRQWEQALRQISVLQECIFTMERAQLARKEEELAALKDQILTAGEQGTLQKDKEALAKLKEQVDNLQTVLCKPNSMEPSTSKATSECHNFITATTNDTAPDAIPSTSTGITKQHSHLQRLIKERDDLLNTGEYTEDDLLITKLNKNIYNG